MLRVATSNAGKIAEFRLGVKLYTAAKEHNKRRGRWAVEPVPGIDALPPCLEDGETFAANAEKKALHYSRFSSGLVLGDDSGLEVDALGGEPGVRSRRYSGAAATDAQNNLKLLQELKDVPAERRGAQFVCVLALACSGEIVAEFRGVARGRILDSPRGKGGFGYDPLFLDPASGKTFAELTPEEKLGCSHRGLAMRQMIAWLQIHPNPCPGG